MSVPLESSITRSIVLLAKSLGWWTFKIAGGPMQTAGIPDLLLVKHGKAVFLEVKRPGKSASPLQAARIDAIRAVGGAVAEVVTSKAQAGEILASCEQEHQRG